MATEEELEQITEYFTHGYGLAMENVGLSPTEIAAVFFEFARLSEEALFNHIVSEINEK